MRAMTNPYWQRETKQHSPDLDRAKELCFVAMCVFESSPQVRALPKAYRRTSRLWKLHDRMAERRLVQTLLELAVIVRTFDDQKRHGDATLYADFKKSICPDGVGRLGEQSLSLREACNKIIHADDLRPIYEDSEVENEETGRQDQYWYMTGEIELKGVRGNKPWDAYFDIRTFLEGCLDLLSFKSSTRTR